MGNDALPSDLRTQWHQTLVLNRPGRLREQVEDDVHEGLADMETYGSKVLANPDFVHWIRVGAPMNEMDSTTFFGGGSKGYTDYPALV